MLIIIITATLFGAIVAWGSYFGASHIIAGDNIGEGIAWLLVLFYVLIREFGNGGVFKK